MQELGDELVTNVASLAILDAQHQAQLAAAVQAHAPYVNQLHAQSLAQGLDVSNLHAFQVQVALAASQMPQQDIQGHLQGNPQLASGQDADQMQGHIGHMVMHPASSQVHSNAFNTAFLDSDSLQLALLSVYWATFSLITTLSTHNLLTFAWS